MDNQVQIDAADKVGQSTWKMDLHALGASYKHLCTSRKVERNAKTSRD